MVRPVLNGSWSSTNARAIDRVQERLSVPFPKVFIEFLKKSNGGAPHPSTFPVGEDTRELSIFYGIGGGEGKDISIFFKSVQRLLESRFSTEEREPFAGLLPFAEDAQGNILFLKDSGSTTTVLLFVRSSRVLPVELVPLGTFGEFLGSFYPSGEEELSDSKDLDPRDEDDEDYGPGKSKRKGASRKRPAKRAKRSGSDSDEEFKVSDRGKDADY